MDNQNNQPDNQDNWFDDQPSKVSEKPQHAASQNNWAQQTLEKVALESIKERKRARRWGIFFKFLMVAYVVFVTAMYLQKPKQPKADVFGREIAATNGQIALIKLDDVIKADDDGVSADKFSRTLLRAADDENNKALLIEANSPGGSPVQSAIIYNTIRQIKTKYPDKPIVTVVTDVCASGCYYIVSATDKIYANGSSIVGSIGVITQGFGVNEAMEKLGLDRRVFTAGKYKDFLDPTKPLKADEVAILQTLLDDLHQQFIDAVKSGRGDKLSDNPDLFSGLFWSGRNAVDLGLVDELKTPYEVANTLGDYPVVNYSRESGLNNLLKQFGVQVGAGITDSLFNTENNSLEFQ